MSIAEDREVARLAELKKLVDLAVLRIEFGETLVALRAKFEKDHAAIFTELNSHLYWSGDGSLGINAFFQACVDGEIWFLGEILRIVAYYNVGKGSPEGQEMRAALVIWANELVTVTNAALELAKTGVGKRLYPRSSTAATHFLPPCWEEWLSLIEFEEA